MNYSFKVGSIEGMVLLDVAYSLGKDGLMERFPDVPEADARQAYTEMKLSLDEADDSRNILLVKTGSETVLIDAGQGKAADGKLLEKLSEAGISPDSITLVVITHAHGDHVFGLVEDNQLVFPNAEYVVTKDEMPYWNKRIESGAASYRTILNMVEEKGLRQIDMNEQIVPGLTAVSLPGHTPGHIGVLLESGGEKLFHVADLLHSPMQFTHPDWSASFDADTRLSVPSRRSALQRAADEKMLMLVYHLTYPGLGHVQQAGDGFSWQPLSNVPTNAKMLE